MLHGQRFQKRNPSLCCKTRTTVCKPYLQRLKNLTMCTELHRVVLGYLVGHILYREFYSVATNDPLSAYNIQIGGIFRFPRSGAKGVCNVSLFHFTSCMNFISVAYQL